MLAGGGGGGNKVFDLWSRGREGLEVVEVNFLQKEQAKREREQKQTISFFFFVLPQPLTSHFFS